MKNYNTSIEWLENDVLKLPEVVNVETVPAILKLVDKAQKSIKVVDFSAVTQADSVALAVLLKWQDAADIDIQIRNLPAELVTLIHLYDLESMLQA
ncbi:MAG: STAS domain-containing protein [Pseudomonadota bacterium]|nr:STAS domain-containing protein [Pseudomonadota bacterium]